MKKIFKFKGKLFQYPKSGPKVRGGWFFIDTGKKLTQAIKKEAGMEPDQFKYLMCKFTIGKTSWKAKLHPMSGKGNFWIVVSGTIRKKEELADGDMVKVEFSIA